MSASGNVRHGDTIMYWDEYKDRIEFQLPTSPPARFEMSYDGGRELLDCLLVLFARQEIRFRYPESR